MIDKMNSIHRRKLLKEVANKERNMESEVLAIIALDEIDELDSRIEHLSVSKVVPNIPSTMLKKGSD